MSIILLFQKIKRLRIDFSRRIDTDTILKSFQRRFNRSVEQCFTLDKRFFEESLVDQDIFQLGYICAPHLFFQYPVSQIVNLGNPRLQFSNRGISGNTVLRQTRIFLESPNGISDIRIIDYITQIIRTDS